jgi:hypothetical protein
MGEGDAGNADKGPGEAKFEMKIGDREVVVNPEFVEQLVAQKSVLDQKVGAASAALKTAEKYGVPVEEYLQNAEAALFIAQDLIAKGILDEKGNLIAKGDSGKAQPPKGAAEWLGGTPPQDRGSEGALNKALGELSEGFTAVSTRLQEIEAGQASLVRRALEGDIKGKYSHLEQRDLSEIFALSRANPKVDFWEVVDKVAKEKEGAMSASEEAFAKKYNLNIDQLRSRIQKSGSEELSGGPSKFVAGKKLMFGNRAKRLGITDAVSPGAAADEWQSKRMELENT